MGLFKFLKRVIYVAVMLMGSIDSAKPTVTIHFHEAPPEYSRFSTAVFRYSVENPDGSNACKNNWCSISCEVDGQTLRSCPPNATVLKNLTANRKHSLLLHVTTRNGERNSSSYSWFIDTIPPTARISSKENYTNAGKTSIDVTFSEACTGLGGFKCINSSNCDVIVDGPANVHTSSLRTIKPNIKYRLDIVFSLKTEYGRVVISMAEGFCTDQAGNSFMRTNNSVAIIHFDRRPVVVDLWTEVPSYVVAINGVPRTVFATNKVDDLKLFLDFSIPVKNTTEEILNALHVTSSNILPMMGRNHGNRKFVFSLKNVTSNEIITIDLKADMIVGRTGAPVSPGAPLTILYDSTQPRVALSTSSSTVTKASNIKVVAEFSKPVFHFEASMVNVEGGKLTRFKELSRALYSFTVLAVTANNVSITIDAGKVKDISGNQNVASNKIQVKHYSTPSISTALHSFVTAGVLATSLTAAALSLSSATLGAIGALSTVNADNVAFNPSMNLHGLFGHLQVFVLSDWFSANHPIDYSETTKGLRWLIPRQTLPWKKEDSSIWPNHVHLAEPNLSSRSFEFLYRKEAYHQIDHLIVPANVHQQLPFPNEVDAAFDLFPRHNISAKTDSFGQPLNAEEYFTYFLRGEPLSASGVVKKMENYKGWQDLEMNLFWLAVGGCSLVVIHIVILLLLRWRTGTPVHGILSVPRFELLLLILMLPCISQSSAFVIRGGTRGGIITGVMLLTIPIAFILSICLFLAIAIFSGNFAQYKEMRHVVVRETWYKKLWFFFTGRPVTGKWFYREGLPSSFLPRFGIVFDNRKGPARFVFVDQNDPTTLPKWTESSQSGIGRMRAVSLDDSNEETEIPMSRRVLGCARSSYILIDLSRRVGLGIISGAFSSQAPSQSIFALAVTLIQFFYLFTFRPYIRRGVHVVECISLLCEAGLFSISASTHTDSTEDNSLGYIMLSLLFLTFIAQLTNEWYALIECLSCIYKPQKISVMHGLKVAAKGLVLPFLPRRHWSRILHSSKPKTGLSSVPPLGPETELERRNTRGPRPESFSAMTATVVPVLSPSPPSMYVTGSTSSTIAATPLAGQRAGEEKRLKGLKVEQKRELKKLRALAKASFSGDSKDEDFGQTSG